MDFKNNLLILVIVVITSFVYLPSINNNFTNWDDQKYVVENPFIKSISAENLKNIFSKFYLANYHPLTLLSFMVEYGFFGDNPSVYHLTNLLLHLVNCILVYLLIFLITDNHAVAFVTSSLFGIHPMNVESVAWVSERKNVLYSIFFLGSSLSYVFYLKTNQFKCYFLSILLFTFSILSKATAVTLPVLLILFEISIRQTKLKKLLINTIPFFVVSSVFLFAAVFAQSMEGKVRIADTSFLLTFYLSKLAFPVKLSCLYPYADFANEFKENFLMYTIIPVIGTIAAVLSLKYTKKIVFGTLFFLINLLPFIVLIPVGIQAAADRYVYVPCVGVFYVFAEFIYWVYNKFPKLKYFVVSLFIAIIAAYSMLTYQRTKIWSNALMLWTDVLAKYPNSQTAHLNIAQSYMETGEIHKAIHHYERFIKVNQSDPQIYYNLGTAYAIKGRYFDAIRALTDCVKIDPYMYRAWHNLGKSYLKSNRKDMAIKCFNKSIEINPGCSLSYYNFALLYYSEKKCKSAVKNYEKAIKYGHPEDKQFFEKLKSCK